MAIWDIFKARTEAGQRAEGRITSMHVDRSADGERWTFALDSRPGEEFVFEPTPLSPIRRQGDRVGVAYQQSADGSGAQPVDQITSA